MMRVIGPAFYDENEWEPDVPEGRPPGEWVFNHWAGGRQVILHPDTGEVERLTSNDWVPAPPGGNLEGHTVINGDKMYVHRGGTWVRVR